MTTIFKLHDGDVPEWMKVAGDEKQEPKVEAPVVVVNDDFITLEMDKIEKCASEGKPYRYSEGWGRDAVNQLEEYACACGLKDFAPGEQPAPVVKEASVAVPVVTAEAKPPTLAEQLKAVMDPFHLDDAGDMKHMEKAKWEVTSPEQKLQPPNAMMSSSSVRMATEDGYFEHPALRPKKGQNSVADPDAIGKLAKEEDTGERLRRENKERAAARKQASQMWQSEMVQKAKDMGAGSLPRGSVFMTEGLYAQPGLTSTAAQKVGFETEAKEVPDFTDGEKLKESNKDRRQSIQRPKQANDWQALKGASRHDFDDTFGESLEKHLANIKKV
jgi:hypothetical protein